jgi:hypothetical protein
MQSPAWVTLLRHIPPKVHEGLMLVTCSGTEIAIQSLLRIDREFVAVKGRVAGSQAAGRVFFVAYDQIDYFGFQQEIKEEQFEEWFAGLVMPELATAPVQQGGDRQAAAAAAAAAVAAAVAAASGAPLPVAPQPAPRPAPAAVEAAVPPPPGSKTVPTLKSAVLERFRSRNSSGLRKRLTDGGGDRPAGDR